MDIPPDLSAGQRAYLVLRATSIETVAAHLQAEGRGFEPLRLHHEDIAGRQPERAAGLSS